ncbi:MAG TPA: EVE domain-containing protein [Balneolales bacterium]|nr:EVE domain-containing protein [Balneolales bacterium]
MSERQYWLMKSEPNEYSIDDLENNKNQTAKWTGIRNYEARNIMRDRMKIGDGVFFYHSNIKKPEIAGTMNVSSKPYPDPTQFDPDSHYFDPKSTEENPRWMLVDVTFTQKFEPAIIRDQLKETGEFSEMALFKRRRLSVQPVTEEEWMKIHVIAGVDPV